MVSPPPLFDMATRKRRRARARAIGIAGFLHREAALQLHERLQDVNKSFTKAAFVGWLPEIWAEGFCPEQVVADEETLALSPSTFDLVVHGLGLHSSNDPVGQLVQLRRALRPDGLMLAALFGGRTLHELRMAFAGAESEVEGGISPRVAPMGDVRDLGGLIQRAGLAMPVADSATLTVTYPSPLHLMRDLRAMGEGNIMTQRRKTPLRRDTLKRAVEIYIEEYGLADGRIPATFEIIFLTGWAPSKQQPKPLKPGSATARLADALGTIEYKGHSDD
ncbi:MAG: methyltransferase domain-containing protein [Rhodobacteraceae bacterium]|nr:methyltransferase domain-containing protein [Paracoccaceae bacterium]